MNAADMAALSRLIDAALEQPTRLRERWIATLGPGHAACVPALKRALARMDKDAPPRPGSLDTLPKIALEDAANDAGAHAHERFGPYRLEHLLGRGGMGEVWLAKRDDGAFDRLVALKLPHAALLSDVLRERFARERDILAALSHPHVAQFLDAGLADSGRPYLAIEWVDGLPITRHCEAAALDIRARLRLALQVLDALEHAHQRLVAHRDIKPSNILVTQDGVAKLLDFGIAKLLGDAAAGASTELTHIGGRALTPDYAAPEQVVGAPVTTAVDIYALGIVLYEMLAGCHPFAGAPRPASGEAPLASTRVAGDAKRRRALRGDLDAILATALDPDPFRRYRTAAAFGADIDRFLRQQPVGARHIGWAARALKFVRRHGVESALVGGLALSIVAGAGTAAWEARRARDQAVNAQREAQRAQRESRRAEAEARRQKATRDFLVGVFKASDPRIGSDQPRGTITARQLLDLGARRLDSSFADDPDTRIEMLGIIGDIYGELDENDRFERVLQRQTELALARHGELSPVTIDCLLRQADDGISRGDTPRVNALLARIDGLIGRAGREDGVERAYWSFLRGMALMPDARAQVERDAALRRALALYERVAPDDPHHAFVLSALGNFAHAAGDEALAADYTRRSIAIVERAADRDDGALAVAYSNLGKTLAYQGNFAEAETAHARAMALAESTYGRDAWPWWMAAANRAQAVHLAGERERAQPMFETLLRILPPATQHFHNAIEENSAARVRETIAGRLAAEGRPARALPLFEAARIGFEHAPTYPDDLRQLRAETGAAAGAAGQGARALRLLHSALDEYVAKAAPSDPGRLQAREALARELWRQRRFAEAEQAWRQVVDDAQDRPAAVLVRTCAGLADAALRRHDVAAATSWSDRALDLSRHLVGARDRRLEPQLALARAAVQLAAGHPQDALPLSRDALAALRRYDAPGSASLAAADAVQRRVLAALER